jgi:small-conductance mechanosensitive channel
VKGVFAESAVVWTVAVAVGYPLLAVLAVEAKRHSAARFPAFSRFVGLLQVSVLPVAAVYLLLSRVAQLPPDGVAVKVAMTTLAIVVINAVLAALNAVMRADAITGEVVNRVPGLLLDILRIFLVLVASAFVASEIWAVDLGSLLAALGVGSVVLGLALQDTLSGLFAGVALLSGRQFKEGDWIEFGEASGKIVKMDWRSITIETLDDERLMVIPNSQLSGGVFTILSSGGRSFGQNLNVSFSYESAPARVMAAIEEAILSVDLILRDPPHDIDLMETTDTGIVYEVTIHTTTRAEGEEAATGFFRRLWYICAREGLHFSGSVNRKYRGRGLPGLSRAAIEEALTATSIFVPSATGFAAVADAARVQLFDEGEKIVTIGRPFTTLYLVVAGLVTVTRGGANHARALQHVGAGEFFVGRAFLTSAPASVELVADGEVMVLAIDSRCVTDFLNSNPRLARLFESAIDASESGLAMVSDDTRLRVVG